MTNEQKKQNIKQQIQQINSLPHRRFCKQNLPKDEKTPIQSHLGQFEALPEREYCLQEPTRDKMTQNERKKDSNLR